MASNRNPWLRLWVDMPTNPKWRTISRSSRRSISEVMAVYLHVLVNASNAEERGVTEHLNEEDIASALDIETEAVAAILAAMQARVMDGARVMGWDKRQPLREDGSAQRAAAYRDRQKLAKQTPDEPLQTQFPQSERNRTQPNAREEKRREEERRGEKRREEKSVWAAARASARSKPAPG